MLCAVAQDGQEEPPPDRRRVPPARSVALVAVGGAIGTLVRDGANQGLAVGAGALPVATLAVNVAGAGLLGVLVTVLADRGPSSWLRLLLATGVLGAFTTFSTFATELVVLAQGGRAALALVYAAVTLVAGVAAAAAGVRLGGRVSVLTTRAAPSR